MAEPPAAPAVTPRPPGDEPESDRSRRLKVWLAAVTVVAIAAAGAAGYAISEIESTKDENRKDDQAVGALRADLDALRKDLNERVDTVEGRLDDTAGARAQRRLEQDLDALDRRVARVARQDDGGESDEITTRVDELEQRIEDLEDEQ